MTTKSLSNASLKALCYASLFNYPLTKQELTNWQIKDRYTVSEKTKKTLQESNGFYFLKGNTLERRKREAISEKKLQIARFYSRIFAFLPSVLFIGVSGSLSRRNAQEDDDIDLFIITKANTLWTTRFLLTLLADFLGIRRKPEAKHTNNKMCFNMFIDETELQIHSGKQNLYTAHEVRLVLPLINKKKTYEAFLAANSWTKQYLPNQEIPKINRLKRKFRQNSFEIFIMNLQQKFMRKKTQEITSSHQIFFHPKDYSKRILKRYKKVLGVS